ncbi:pentapeptide repeat-containing protein [Lentzea sp. NPDC051208]|uniref:pentapeptide repeat-containing protein n=1 Tax=Lentzea sp. NPDC051208 TaxID=3154642 RepID=UPI00341521A2
MRNKNLSNADFRGAYLIGADLTNSDLSRADMIGADLRGAELSGADLSTCLFLTQPQVNAARGNAKTKLPAALSRPAHWTAEPARRR